MNNPTLNQVYANNAQRVDIPTALETAKFLTGLATLFGEKADSSVQDKDLYNLWKLRAFAFLNRACELECVPVHKRVVETSNGLEDIWCSYGYRCISDIHDSRCINYSGSDLLPIQLGYCSSMTESQARMRALS